VFLVSEDKVMIDTLLKVIRTQKQPKAECYKQNPFSR
jgi:hypothetical protein